VRFDPYTYVVLPGTFLAGGEMRIAIAQLADEASASRRPSTQQPTASAGASAVAAESSRSWSGVTDQLLRLRRLEDDWDGQGASAPAPATVDAALGVAGELRAVGVPPADRAIAGVNGTIFFEWHDAGRYLEVEVCAPDRTEGRWVYTDTNTVDEFTLTR